MISPGNQEKSYLHCQLVIFDIFKQRISENNKQWKLKYLKNQVLMLKFWN